MITQNNLNDALKNVQDDKLQGHAKRISVILQILFINEKISEFKAIAIARCSFIRHYNDLHPCIIHYNETRTCFWVKEIWTFFNKNLHTETNGKKRKRTLEELITCTLKSPLGNKNYINSFYSVERQKSEEAHAIYLPPDKK